ncbi:hypothetical protein HHI36_022072 [Cryptolaemus montrouzieri]|uniref:Ionotropic receptor n=1 Tax=Cryptolaemus montrouzieri TaxID=559131 RepID=A0ABD2MZF0_9CUCU
MNTHNVCNRKQLGTISMNSSAIEVFFHGSTLREPTYTCGVYGNDKIKSLQDLNATVYFYYAPPYAFCVDCENKGITLDLISMALDLLNIKSKLEGALFINPDVKKIVESILEDSSVIFLITGASSEFDFTQPFLYDNGYWIIRSPNEIPRWRYIIRIFSVEVWASWILSSIFLTLAWFATIYRRTSKLNTLNDAIQGFLIILKHFIEQPFSLKPSTISQSIVLATILMSTFLMNLFFDSKFSYILTGFNYEKSIESFEDLMENKLEVVLADYMLEYFENDKKALKYFKKYRTASKITLEAVVEENKAVPFPDVIFHYEYHNYLDSNQRPLIRKLNPPLMTIFLYAVLRKGNPLTNPLNQKLIRLVEHGFATYIFSKYKSHKIVRDKKLDVKKLTLNHIHLPLTLWIIGILLSIICFLSELKF